MSNRDQQQAVREAVRPYATLGLLLDELVDRFAYWQDRAQDAEREVARLKHEIKGLRS